MSSPSSPIEGRPRCVFCERVKATQADWDRNAELDDEQAEAEGLDELCWEAEDDSCLALLADSGRPTNLEAALEALTTSTQPNPIGDREQLQELLEAVESHRDKLSAVPLWAPLVEDRTLYALADRIRDEQKAGS